MPKSLYSFKEQFREQALHFLWRQWGTLGVAAHTAPERCVIDPEALILLTTTFGRYDPRLFDEALDWLVLNGSAVNLQRLKNFVGRFGQRRVLAAMADVVGKKPAHLKWRNLVKEWAVPKAKPLPLFHHVPVIGIPDKTFLKQGWQRDALQLRKLSAPPNPHLPANLLFKLRALFGLQARAEIMAALLCSDATQPARIAEMTGYFSRTVQVALNEMAGSGHLLKATKNREKHFQLRKEEWRFLMKSTALPQGEAFPRWVQWSPLFEFLERIEQKISDLEKLPPRFIAKVFAAEMRGVLEESLPALLQAGWPMHASPEMPGDTLLEAFHTDTMRLLKGEF